MAASVASCRGAPAAAGLDAWQPTIAEVDAGLEALMDWLPVGEALDVGRAYAQAMPEPSRVPM